MKNLIRAILALNAIGALYLFAYVVDWALRSGAWYSFPTGFLAAGWFVVSWTVAGLSFVKPKVRS